MDNFAEKIVRNSLEIKDYPIKSVQSRGRIYQPNRILPDS